MPIKRTALLVRQRGEGVPANSAVADEIRRRVASLPPLPANWQPDNILQQGAVSKTAKNLTGERLGVRFSLVG